MRFREHVIIPWGNTQNQWRNKILSRYRDSTLYIYNVITTTSMLDDIFNDILSLILIYNPTLSYGIRYPQTFSLWIFRLSSEITYACQHRCLSKSPKWIIQIILCTSILSQISWKLETLSIIISIIYYFNYRTWRLVFMTQDKNKVY